MTKCYVISWMGSWDRKRPLVKTKEIPIKYGFRLIMKYQYGFITYDKRILRLM